MEQELETKYAKRLEEIDARIEGLRSHQSMWFRAGGVGGKMAMQANAEIKELIEEKKRILSGKQQKIDEIKSVKEVLELLKKRVKNHKRKKDYDKVIEEAEEEIRKVL